MAVGFNSQQQSAIEAYRKKHNLGYVISNEEIASRIKKEGGSAASIFNQRNALPALNFSQGAQLRKPLHIQFSAQAINPNLQPQPTIMYQLLKNRQQKSSPN